MPAVADDDRFQESQLESQVSFLPSQLLRHNNKPLCGVLFLARLIELLKKVLKMKILQIRLLKTRVLRGFERSEGLNCWQFEEPVRQFVFLSTSAS